MQEFNVSFPKKERLHAGKLIELLFKKGRSFTFYPLKVIWLHIPEPSLVPVQLMVSVPKRNFKKAVDRNLLRRRIKEAYRLNKYLLHSSLHPEKGQVLVSIVYIAPKALSYAEIQEKIILILQRLTGENEKITV